MNNIYLLQCTDIGTSLHEVIRSVINVSHRFKNVLEIWVHICWKTEIGKERNAFNNHSYYLFSSFTQAHSLRNINNNLFT